VEIVALLTKCIVYESYINATGCLNTILLLNTPIKEEVSCKILHTMECPFNTP
jgi:hypothetical protein